MNMPKEVQVFIVSFCLITYRQGCNDYYRNQASYREEQLDKIMEYLHCTMTPFIELNDMEAFCAEIMSFAINPAHKTDYLSLPVYRTSSAFIVLLQKQSNHTTVFAVGCLCLLAKTMKIPVESLCYHSIII